MNELKAYLETNYPKGGKMYLLLVISIMNDHHRRCYHELLPLINQYDNELGKRIVMNKVVGSAMYDTRQWLEHIDRDLYQLLMEKGAMQFMLQYLGAEAFRQTERKLADIIHGEGYSDAFDAAVLKAIEKRNTTHPTATGA